jgi:hypothetical protein
MHFCYALNSLAMPDFGKDVWFTQTDPMPYGAGTAYEGPYVYAGARPTVMTDPGGERFGLAAGFGLIPEAFASKTPGKTPPPTTRVRIVGNKRCVTREKTKEEIKKGGGLGGSGVVTTCTTMPKAPVTTSVAPAGTQTLLAVSFDAKTWAVNLWIRKSGSSLTLSALQTNQAPDDGEGNEQVSELLFVKSGVRIGLSSFRQGLQRLNPRDLGPLPVDVRWSYTYDYNGGATTYSPRSCQIRGEGDAKCYYPFAGRLFVGSDWFRVWQGDGVCS